MTCLDRVSDIAQSDELVSVVYTILLAVSVQRFHLILVIVDRLT